MVQFSTILGTDGDQPLAVPNTAVTLTLPAYFTSGTGVTQGKAIIQCRTAAVLFTLNGIAPTAADRTTGTQLAVEDQLILETLAEMQNVKFIRATGTDGALFIIYQKRVN